MKSTLHLGNNPAAGFSDLAIKSRQTTNISKEMSWCQEESGKGYHGVW
jgi:hypothetical protein